MPLAEDVLEIQLRENVDAEAVKTGSSAKLSSLNFSQLENFVAGAHQSQHST